jgi:hypothetical protein
VGTSNEDKSGGARETKAVGRDSVEGERGRGAETDVRPSLGDSDTRRDSELAIAVLGVEREEEADSEESRLPGAMGTESISDIVNDDSDVEACVVETDPLSRCVTGIAVDALSTCVAVSSPLLAVSADPPRIAEESSSEESA